MFDSSWQLNQPHFYLTPHCPFLEHSSRITDLDPRGSVHILLIMIKNSTSRVASQLEMFFSCHVWQFKTVKSETFIRHLPLNHESISIVAIQVGIFLTYLTWTVKHDSSTFLLTFSLLDEINSLVCTSLLWYSTFQTACVLSFPLPTWRVILRRVSFSWFST